MKVKRIIKKENIKIKHKRVKNKESNINKSAYNVDFTIYHNDSNVNVTTLFSSQFAWALGKLYQMNNWVSN